MTNQPNQSDRGNDAPWESCPPGLLVTMADDLTADKRRSQMVRNIAVASIVLLACGALIVRSFTVDHFAGGIYCSECKPHFAAYSAHLEGKPAGGETLRPELLDQMRLHLAGCSRCRGKFEEMYPGALAYRQSGHHRLIAAYSNALRATAFGSTRTAAPIRRWY